MATEDLRITAHPILEPLRQGFPVTFSFNGRPVVGQNGEPIAVALWVAGIRVLGQNTVTGQPRGVYCGIGHCFECRVEVDGNRNVRSCLEPVRAGMQVRSILRDGAVEGGVDHA